jgi:hypothetical protein
MQSLKNYIKIEIGHSKNKLKIKFTITRFW